MSTTRTPLPTARWLSRLLPAYLAAVTLEYLLLPPSLRDLTGLQGIARMSPVRILLLGGAFFLLLWLPAPKELRRWLLPGIFAVLSAASLAASFTWAFLGACLLILGVLTAYALLGWDDSPPPRQYTARENPLCKGLMIAMTCLFFLFVSLWTVCRVLSFSTPTYDFGIFAQMFHQMRATGLPNTTLERDGLLSHFAVHVSPVYYLLLPFYCLFPHAVTLQILQAAVLASGVIPLWKLGKLHGLSPLPRLLLGAALLLYPAYSGGAGYDIHENCFLTPLLLWLFYGVDQENAGCTAVAAVLTLGVKEDAAVYVAVVGLWLLLRAALHPSPRAARTGAALLALALSWFLLVTAYLSGQGDGVMTYRYNNLIYDGSGSLLAVVKSVLRCPMKAVFEAVDPEKLPYIAMTLGPLLGLPLMTRRFERYLLLIPYVLVNLMSDYVYQHDLFFQYGFGSAAFLFYLTLVNLADLRLAVRQLAALICAVGVSLGCFCATVAPTAMWYPARYLREQARDHTLSHILSQIPEDAAVTATTFYTTPLSSRAVLYDLRYCSEEHLLSSDYIVLDPGATDDLDAHGGYEALTALLAREGYALCFRLEDALLVYFRPQSGAPLPDFSEAS